MPSSRGRKKPRRSRPAAARRHIQEPSGPIASSSASTRLRRQRRVRPGWHRPAGIAVAILGVVLILVNYAEDFNLGWLPGGHKELYFLLGVVMGAVGAWFLSAFDKPA